MMAITVENLSKIYRLYKSPVDRLKEIFLGKAFHTPFPALQDITFSVQIGETLGIIGENGAGKSTLLKILANTLKPTSGTFSINGKVAALLELGAGFNPELSGEENIYLNAYLMGLSEREAHAKKAAIIAFSELGEAINRPVKTYSSGMYIRLAFSIAVCVDPDILIIDEVLAVGDQHFQKKCINKIAEFKQNQKTILFCSHSLYYVQELCDRSLWLKDATIERIGENATIINAYLNQIRERDAKTNTLSSLHPEPESNTPLSKIFWIDRIIVRDRHGREKNCFTTGEDIQVQFSIQSAAGEKTDIGHIGIGISRNDNIEIFGSDTKREGFDPIVFHNNQDITVTFPAIPLLTGQYFFTISLGDEHALHPYDIQKSEIFQIVSRQINWGVMHLEHRWEFNV